MNPLFLTCTVNLGDDADTVGAIYGQLAGAYYSVGSIPAEWKQKCALHALIELFADELVRLSSTISIPDNPIPDTVDWTVVNTPVPQDKRVLYMYTRVSLVCSVDCIITTVSDAYRNLKIKGYDLLEEGNRQIVRKLNPCPKQYKT